MHVCNFVLTAPYSLVLLSLRYVCVYVGGCQRSVSSQPAFAWPHVQYIPHVCTYNTYIRMFHLPFCCAALSILCSAVFVFVGLGPPTRFCYHACLSLPTTAVAARPSAPFFVSVLFAPNWLCEFLALTGVSIRLISISFHTIQFQVFHAPWLACACIL